MKNLLAVFLLSSTFISFGQQDTEKYNFFDSEKIIKVDFGDIFTTVPVIGCDIESKVNDDLSLQFGAGIIPSLFQPWVGNRINDFDQLRGYQLRAESRFYIFKKPTRYIATDVSFRHLIIRDRNVPVGMDLFENPNGVDEFAYFVNTDMRFHQFRTSIAVKWGFQKNLGEHFTFDFNVGLRLRSTYVQSGSKLPKGGVLQADWNNRMTLIDNYRRSNTLPTFGFKLGYRL